MIKCMSADMGFLHVVLVVARRPWKFQDYFLTAADRAPVFDSSGTRSIRSHPVAFLGRYHHPTMAQPDLRKAPVLSLHGWVPYLAAILPLRGVITRNWPKRNRETPKQSPKGLTVGQHLGRSACKIACLPDRGEHEQAARQYIAHVGAS